MRIALLSYDYPPETDGDSELGSHAFMHAKGLASLGHEVHVFAGCQKSGWRSVRDGAVTVTRFHYRGPLQRLVERSDTLGLDQVGERISMSADTVRALRRALRDGDFDVIETDAVSGEAALLAPLKDLPLVVRVQDLLGLRGDQPGRSLDRQLALCIERLSIDSALAISTSSSWVLERLRERQDLACPAVVIPNGIDPEIANDVMPVDICDAHGVPAKGIRIYCPSLPSGSQTQSILIEVLVQALRDYPSTFLVLPARRGKAEHWAGLTDALKAADLSSRAFMISDADEVVRRAAIRQTDIFVRFADQGEGCSFELLEAMACGAAMAVGRANGITELLRPEIDAIIFDQSMVEPGRQAIQRLVEQSELRQRLGDEVAKRCRESYDLETVARQRDSFYHYALQRRVPTQIKRPSGPTLPLGPDNWFHVWWLERSTRTSPSMALDEQGKPLFAQLTIDALRFVETMLNRSWCQGPAEWQAPEWGFLKELNGLLLELALERRHQSATENSEVGMRLNLPPLSHPLFASDQGSIFLDEFWRLDRVPGIEGWLHREVTTDRFPELAVQRLTLRRLAVEALHRCPSKDCYAVAREIYRGPGIHEVVIAEDREFFDSGHVGERFKERVDGLGLHAPLHRQPYLQSAAETSSGVSHPVVAKPTAAKAGAQVTVLIPSYQHEAFIEDAIQSVLNQSRGDFDLLVVDDGSTDRTVALAKAISDPRLEVRVNETNLGLGHSVQNAVATIQTPYVALLNSDDLFHPERLERCLSSLDAQRRVGLVATGLEFIDRDGRQVTTGDSCVIEVGPRTHGWLQWYELIRGQFAKPEEWVSLRNLIRHNILATSSNMVFRTTYLKKHMPAASALKYCLDWQLFMIAAMEERLCYLPDPLLAYRFHDDNTVWFQDGGRSGYILEVNRVIGTVLRALVTRRRKSHAASEVVAELSELLQTDVIQHGETDGLAMYLVELARGLDKNLDCLDASVSEIDELASGAIVRNTLTQVSERIDIDPWDLVGLSQEAERFRIETHIAEEFLNRARQLEGEIGRLRHELNGLYRKTQETVQTEEAFEQERLNMRSELIRVREEMFSLFKRKDELEIERVELSESHQQLAQSHEQLAQSKDELAESKDKLAQSRDQLQEQKKQLEEVGRSLEGELKNLQGVLDDTHRRGVELREELELAAVIRDQSVAAMEVAEGEVGGLQMRLRAIRIAKQLEGLRIEALPQARFTRLFLDKLRLLGVWKTCLRLRHMLCEPAWRGAAHFGRLLSTSGRKRRRVLLACPRRFPSAGTISRALEARALIEAGFDLQILSFGKGSRRELGEGYGMLAGRNHALQDDGWVASQDRAYFEGRRGEQVSRLSALKGVEAFLPKAFRFARLAKTLGGGVVLVHALDETALYALAAQDLCGIPFALVLGAEVLAERSLDETVVKEIFAKATLIGMNSLASKDQLVTDLGFDLDGRAIQRPPFAFDSASSANHKQEMRILCLGVYAGQDLACLAEAIKVLRGRGIDARVDMLGEPQPAHGQLRVWDDLFAAINRLGIRDSFELHGSTSLRQQGDLLQQATVLVELSSETSANEPVCGLPQSIPAAMAASVPVVASRCAALEEIESSAIRLVDPGKPQDLAETLITVHRDLDCRAGLVASGQKVIAAKLNASAANQDWSPALRRILGMEPDPD